MFEVRTYLTMSKCNSCEDIVRNSAETILANFSGKTQIKMFNGRPHLVAPLTLVVPGVLNGSKGPLLYPIDEIKKDPEAWNGMPIVLDHPESNGSPISARNPKVIDRQGLGTVFNTKVNGKLTAEGWFDIEKTKQVNRTIYNMLKRGEPIELSTGLFADKQPENGVFNGKEYEFIAKNYKPDHLAILLDKVGACSLSDGCGVLANKTGEPKMKALTKKERKTLINSIIVNCDCWDKEDYDLLSNLDDEKLKKLDKSMSDNDDTTDDTTKKKPAKAADTEDEDTTNDDDGDNDASDDEEDKKTSTENDVALLKEFSKKELEDELKKRNSSAPAAKPTANAAKTKPLSEKAWLASAPVKIRNLVKNAMEAEQTQKEALIEKILSVPQNMFSAEELQAKGIEELAKLAQMVSGDTGSAMAATVPAANYLGMAAPLGNTKDSDEDLLIPPTINWSEGKKSA